MLIVSTIKVDLDFLAGITTERMWILKFLKIFWVSLLGKKKFLLLSIVALKIIKLEIRPPSGFSDHSWGVSFQNFSVAPYGRDTEKKSNKNKWKVKKELEYYWQEQ